MRGIAENPIVYFDGVCRLCNGAVRFIARRDPRKRFRFETLQSDAGRLWAERLGLKPEAPGSLVLVLEDRAYTRSDAALRIAGGLRAPWPLLVVFRIVPRPLRDALYNWIARNRYRWFGQFESCPLPDADLRDRFVP